MCYFYNKMWNCRDLRIVVIYAFVCVNLLSSKFRTGERFWQISYLIATKKIFIFFGHWPDRHWLNNPLIFWVSTPRPIWPMPKSTCTFFRWGFPINATMSHCWSSSAVFTNCHWAQHQWFVPNHHNMINAPHEIHAATVPGKLGPGQMGPKAHLLWGPAFRGSTVQRPTVRGLICQQAVVI